MVLLGCSRSKVILGVLTEVKEASNKDKWVRKKYMGVDSVGLREMVVMMKRLVKTVNRKMNRKTTKGTFCRCGSRVSPRRTKAVTLLGSLNKCI